jgi:hypothetical protein
LPGTFGVSQLNAQKNDDVKGPSLFLHLVWLSMPHAYPEPDGNEILLGIELPIVQPPMAGPGTAAFAS